MKTCLFSEPLPHTLRFPCGGTLVATLRLRVRLDGRQRRTPLVENAGHSSDSIACEEEQQGSENDDDQLEMDISQRTTDSLTGVVVLHADIINCMRIDPKCTTGEMGSLPLAHNAQLLGYM